MSTELTKSNGSSDMHAIEKVLVDGDLALLTPSQRVTYYNRTCESLGLNPLTKPFAYIKLNGQLKLYALKDATEQLRKINAISIEITSRTLSDDGTFEVVARASMHDGRKDEDVGAVCLTGLKGEALSNARMKATTKAKRRVTLSICGLGFLDESEVSSVPTAKVVTVTEDGEIISNEMSPERKAELLLELHHAIDEAVSVDDLMSVYQRATKAGLDEKTVGLVKKACGVARKRIEEQAS